MNTSRRTILGAGAALALPVWMARAFESEAAIEKTDAGLETPTLASARERARMIGKPLLVILTDPEGQEEIAGYVWGEFFALATQDTWLDLALVEVVCLPRAMLTQYTRTTREDTVWAVLLESEGEVARIVQGTLTAPTVRLQGNEYGEQARARSAALAALVHSAVLPDAAAHARRSALALESLGRPMPLSPLHGSYEAALGADSPVRFVDLDRFAALVRFQDPPMRLEQLVLAARVRLFENDPLGARWNTGSNYCPPCGMGHVTAESRYFLSFYAQ